MHRAVSQQGLLIDAAKLSDPLLSPRLSFFLFSIFFLFRRKEEKRQLENGYKPSHTGEIQKKKQRGDQSEGEVPGPLSYRVFLCRIP